MRVLAEECNLQRALKTGLGLGIGAAVQDEQFATQPPDLRLVHPLTAGLDPLEGFSNGGESLSRSRALR
jgi:hypothetical protein